jgi:hypothetical protein
MLNGYSCDNFRGFKRCPGCISDHRRRHRGRHVDLSLAAHFRASNTRVVLTQKPNQICSHEPFTHSIPGKLHLKNIAASEKKSRKSQTVPVRRATPTTPLAIAWNIKRRAT